MPIGTYTMLKGTKPSFGEKDTTSAFYYAYGPGSGAVKKYGTSHYRKEYAWSEQERGGMHISLWAFPLRILAEWTLG